MISRWITIIKHLQGNDVIDNIENDEAKKRFGGFCSGKSSVDVSSYENRIKTPKVILVAKDRKMVTASTRN